MVPRIETRRRSLRERLHHLAIVFKIDLRLKIVVELNSRAMSARDFFEEFGGGSLERVAQIFALLERHGWLRRVGQKQRGPGRRGRPETLYRATDLPFFDAETWAALPYSLRLAYSWSSFAAIAQFIRQGMEGAFFERRPSRPLTCTPLELDEIAWTRVISKLDRDFESIFEEQEDARVRCSGSGREVIRAGILQIGFESPSGEDRLGPCLVDGSTEPSASLSERMAPILADDLSMQILSELNATKMSVKQFYRELAEDQTSEGTVRYRFDQLRELVLIAIADEVKNRGSDEKFYRATRPALSTKGAWTGAPEALAGTETWTEFVRLSDLVKEAIVAGTFDIRDDRHLSWSIVSLDREGWQNVARNMDELSAFMLGEEKHAQKRIAAGAKPISMVVGLTAIESRIGPEDKAP